MGIVLRSKLPLTCSAERLGIAVLFYLLLLQNPLEQMLPVFKWTDELAALWGLVCFCYLVLKNGRLRANASALSMGIAFGLFLLAGLLGNYWWRYQPLGTVLTDLYTNMKFFLALISGAALLRREMGCLGTHARIAAAGFFVLLVLDLGFGIFPSGERRYGFPVVRLCYSHATYLAGAMVFLLAVLTAEYEKRNRKYIAMCLAVLVFTFRGKALAGAAIYCFVFFFLLVRRKKLRLRHLILIAAGALAVAWDRFAYYYLELQGQSARSVLTQTAVRIAGDYFPFGTGFGTYGAHVAADPYSPVYVKYGFLNKPELGGGAVSFFDDTFFPIILGQTGVAGSLCYLLLLALLFWRILQVRRVSISGYCAGVFVFLYLMVSATSEPAFNNSIAIPLALLLGQIITRKGEEPVEKTERNGYRNLPL